jgi:Domain of unknown function (DUF4111)/Nucleotidyltransferase domain
MPAPALPKPLDRMLPVLAEDLRSTLGSTLVGVYLYGSAISGGFDPALSDLDVVVVTDRPVDAVEFSLFEELVQRLQARQPHWAGRLDIVFVGRRTLESFRAGGPLLEISHEEPLRLLPDASQYLETWFLLRSADTAIIGPPATSLVPPIETREFLSEVVAGIDGFIARVRPNWPSDKIAYRVITLCRVLRSLESGSICTKQEGAEWAAERYPTWAPLIRSALEVRAANGARELATHERAMTGEFLEFLRTEIHRAAGA